MQTTYYDNYWAAGQQHSGKRQGYAPFFLSWMDSELRSPAAGSGAARMLDAGCGDASFTPALARYSTETHAIDISAAQIEAHKQQHPAVHFRTHDLSLPLPYADAYFDAVWCSEVLEHLFDPYFALKEFRRVLKPGGKLLVTVPYHGGLKSVLIALFLWDEHFDPEFSHVRFFTIGSLARISRKAGFTSLAFSTCGISKPLRDLFIPTNIMMSGSC